MRTALFTAATLAALAHTAPAAADEPPGSPPPAQTSSATGSPAPFDPLAGSPAPAQPAEAAAGQAASGQVSGGQATSGQGTTPQATSAEARPTQGAAAQGTSAPGGAARATPGDGAATTTPGHGGEKAEIRWKLPSWMPSVDISPGLDVIASYALRVTPGQGGVPERWFHAFEMSRAMPSLQVKAGPAVAAVTLEGVYSATEGALIGVAGDSFVMRVREARAGYRLGTWLAVDAGIVPTFTVPLFDQTFGLRALGPVSGELTGFTAPADLGVIARVSLPRGYGFIGAGAYNGEGYTNRELNRGKNIEVAALVHPLPGGSVAPLAVYGAYVNGSSGTGVARADRITAALLWQGDRVRGGAALTYALGVRDDGTREAASVDWSVRGEPIRRFILGARGLVYLRDMKATGDHIVSVTGLAGYRLAEPLEVFVALTRQIAEAATLSSLPGSDFWEGRAAARFQL